MRASLVVGVDCSTTGAKAVAYDRAGIAVATGQYALEMSTPAPGWCEQDADDWRVASRRAIQDVTSAVNPELIAAVGITCQRESFAVLDVNDRPLRPGILWLDTRAGDQVARFGSPRTHQLSGKPPSTVAAYYKLLWLREHEPSVYEATRTVIDVAGWLTWDLTGRRASSVGVVDSLGLLDLANGKLSDELVSQVGLVEAQLPSLVDPGEVIGTVTPAAGKRTGLLPGTPVVASVGDGQAAGLGSDAFRRGRAFLSLGTGLATGVVSSTYEISRSFRTLSGPWRGSFVLEGLLSSGAATITWLRNLFEVGEERLDEHALTRLADTVAPGADGLMMVPYLVSAETPYWDPAARAVLVGLRSSHGPAHVIRASFEGVAHETRLLLEGITTHRNMGITEVVVTGGGSRSPVWCQIFADVIGRPVLRCDRAEVSALGAAVHAAYAVGLEDGADIPTTAAMMSGTGEKFEPSGVRHHTYDVAHATYREIYPSLAYLFKEWPSSGL